MYRKHFGIQLLPFENVPDPLFFFDSGDYHRVLKRMRDAVSVGRGLLAVAGPIGSGKTTLSQKLISDLPANTRLVWMAEPPKDSNELFIFLAQDLGIRPDNTSRVFLLRDIREQLINFYNNSGRRCLMIVDESHLVSDDVLEGIRLLNNLETGSIKLVQIVLLGQPELLEILSRPELEAFKQRLTGLEIVGKMSPENESRYIAHRLTVAGAGAEIFTEEAVRAIAIASGGIPRLTNSLCDRSLNCAYEEGKDKVSPEIVYKGAEELGLAHKVFHFMVDLRAGRNRAVADGVMESPHAVVEEEDARTNDLDHVRKDRDRYVEQEADDKEDLSGSLNLESAVAERSGDWRSLILPLMFFSSSVGALLFSIWFYVKRST